MQRYWAHYSEKGPFIQNWYNNNGDCAKKFDWHLIATKNNQLYCTWWQSNFVHKKICDPGIAHPIANNALVYLETLINKSNPRIKVDHYLDEMQVFELMLHTYSYSGVRIYAVLSTLHFIMELFDLDFGCNCFKFEYWYFAGTNCQNKQSVRTHLGKPFFKMSLPIYETIY